MGIRSLSSQQIKQAWFWVLFSLIFFYITGCSNSRQEFDIAPLGAVVGPTATATLIEPTRVIDVASIEPIEAKFESPNENSIETTEKSTQVEPLELPEVNLPLRHVQALETIARSNNLNFTPLARENTAIYALPQSEGGLVFFLTPAQNPLDFSSKELAADPSRYADQMLGGLSVVRQVNNDLPALPPDDYVITLSADSARVIFTGAEQSFEVEAVIRTLPRQAWQRPIAIITARQMCLSWIVTQVCAVVDTPLPPNLTQELQTGAQRLLQNGDQFFTFDLSLPDIVGVGALQRCEEALNQGEAPNYGGCWSTLMAAPAVAGGFPILSALREEPGTVATTGISLFNILEPVEEEVFCNDQRRVLAFGECIESDYIPGAENDGSPQIPPEEYLVYHVESRTDPQVVDGVTGTRMVLFTLPYISYVVPAFNGVTVIGDPVPGREDPVGTDEAGIAINFRNRICAFWECRWLPRRGSWRQRWWR